MAALDVPLLDARASEARHPEERERSDEVDRQCAGPPRKAQVAFLKAADDPARPGQGKPYADALKIAHQDRRVAAHGPNEEECASHVHERERAREQQPPLLERRRNRRRDDEPGQHQHEQRDPDGQALRIQPVGDPGGVDPHPPERQQEEADFGRAPQGEVLEQGVRKLRDGENEDEIEEQLDHLDSGAFVAASLAQ